MRFNHNSTVEVNVPHVLVELTHRCDATLHQTSVTGWVAPTSIAHFAQQTQTNPNSGKRDRLTNCPSRPHRTESPQFRLHT